jgi:hypothetical protein
MSRSVLTLGEILARRITINNVDISNTLFVDCLTGKSRDSAAGIATGYGLDDRGVGIRVPVG